LDYWIQEAFKQLEGHPPDYSSALFCSKKATDAATSDIEWGQARNAVAAALFHLGILDEAIGAFSA